MPSIRANSVRACAALILVSTANTSGGTDPGQFPYHFVPARSFYLGLRIDLL